MQEHDCGGGGDSFGCQLARELCEERGAGESWSRYGSEEGADEIAVDRVTFRRTTRTCRSNSSCRRCAISSRATHSLEVRLPHFLRALWR